MEDGQRRGWLDVRWQWVAEERCSDWKCASTDGCDLLSQKVSCLLPTWPLCSFRHYWPWHLDHPSLILVWCPWLCSQLVQVISLSSRCFRVKCETDLSSWYTSSCGVPQGYVFGPTLFVMYTTPLSTFISSWFKCFSWQIFDRLGCRTQSIR